LFVPQQITPWPVGGDHPRRAAASSYGLSGTNVHAIIEQAPEHVPEQSPGQQPGERLFPLSSTSANQLRCTADRLAHWVSTHRDVDLADLAYTLTRRRTHRPFRT